MYSTLQWVKNSQPTNKSNMKHLQLQNLKIWFNWGTVCLDSGLSGNWLGTWSEPLLWYLILRCLLSCWIILVWIRWCQAPTVDFLALISNISRNSKTWCTNPLGPSKFCCLFQLLNTHPQILKLCRCTPVFLLQGLAQWQLMMLLGMWISTVTNRKQSKSYMGVTSRFTLRLGSFVRVQ